MQSFDFNSQGLDQKLLKIRRQSIQVSLIRILVFFTLGAVAILGVSEHPFWLILAAAIGILFVRLIQRYTFLKDQEAIYNKLDQILRERKNRIDRQLTGLDTGMEFMEKEHPFSGDLDLFGLHSFFQLLNHTGTAEGKSLLASAMKAPFDFRTIAERQLAVKDLAGRPSFLEAMEAVSRSFPLSALDRIKWEAWLKKIEPKSVLFQVLAVVGPLGGVLISVGLYAEWIPQWMLGLWILLGAGFLSRIFQPLKNAAESIPVASHLKSWRLRAQLIEQEKFSSERLIAEQEKLGKESQKSSELLNDLDRLGLWVQNRINLLYIPLNLIFWLDFLIYFRLVKWKSKVGDSLGQLPHHLDHWEVWISLGGFEYELGGKGEVILDQEKMLSGTKVSHPLLLPQKAIANSLSFNAEKRLVLLTGANMSGKTTFMRTLGINCVLVNLGLSPYAESITFGDFQLFTSMRNTDNLGESVSSFYAELSRIRRLIDRVESGETIFFLLDEILKGTNTEDRISGSKALIQQILQTPGFGIISTHDIELSELGKSEGLVHNFSFHSQISDEFIHFDYFLKEGPCPSFNAHKLMELMGIRFKPKA
ncbi:MutS-related protein [Algoriphagus sanaruensis]|uniref:DNA mismatch repair proteins mutS family domain-containing protein n=1 Tax=Algoriphagus sanaruensis TaxID=1727163 RepID=A0A142EK20_9BACT|nr:hypothetical protein [Algoriphagus sanaruensis]AMQ55475.1 hypothetical protein AO498_03615 [Algoriphagus sanaruensis]